MANITGDYWPFYLEGRGEKRLLKHDIAEDALAEGMVKTGANLRDALLTACLLAIAPLQSGRSKRTWIAEHKTAIAEAGGNAAQFDEMADDAYAAYLRGRADELAYALEPAVVEELERLTGEDLDDEEGEDDEDEEEDEDD